MDLNEILGKFEVKTKIEEYGNGHINDTYLCESRYILQRINVNVFENPAHVMENIYNVTEHIGKKIKAAGGISSLEDAQKFIEAGASRLGTSRIVKIVSQMNI